MGSNRLKLNADKTKVISREQLDKVDISELQLQSSIVQFTNTVSDLGVMVDSQLSAQVTAVCRSCMFQMRQLRLSDIPYWRTDRRHWSVHSSAVDSTTATASWPVWRDDKTAVCSECSSVIHLKVWKVRPYHTHTSWPALVHGLAPHYFIHEYIPVSSLSGRQTLKVCRHAQTVSPEDVHKLRVAIFLRI